MTRKRSKQNSDYWYRRLQEMFTDIPQSKQVAYRYRALRYLLIKQYPDLEKQISKETLLSVLKDADYLNRQIRLYTEGNEKDLKENLAQEKILELQNG